MKQLLLMIMLMIATANAGESALAVEEFTIPQNHQANLMVFVSLSMPKHSLQQWNAQVAKAGGTLMLRGLVNNSMRATTKKVQAIIGNVEGGFAVDPNKFKQFAIKVVPTVVVVSANNNQLFDSIAGDVGLERALEKIMTDGEHKDLAKFWLQNLRGNS